MPCDYSKYPPDWKTRIVPSIRIRSNDCCEVCGAPNGVVVYRLNSKFSRRWWEKAQFFFGLLRSWESVRLVRIVLTVAHLNHSINDNRPENLAHLCQLCHNRHDAAYRAANRKRKREESLCDQSK